jgi:hypothetical protein
LEKTATKRNSFKLLKRYKTILSDIKNSCQKQKFCNGYSKSNNYANGISFDKVCDIVNKTLKRAVEK